MGGYVYQGPSQSMYCCNVTILMFNIELRTLKRSDIEADMKMKQRFSWIIIMCTVTFVDKMIEKWFWTINASLKIPQLFVILFLQ